MNESQEITARPSATSAPINERLAANASWMLVGKVAGFFLQALYFTVLARLLGVYEYGVFAGAFALVNTLTPYSALGAAMLFMRYLSLDRKHAPEYWGNSLLTTSLFTASACLAVGIFNVVHHVSGDPSSKGMIVLILLIANCLFLQITTLGGMLTFALGDARTSAWMSLLTNFCRVLILAVMWGVGRHANALQWSVGLLFASVLAAVVVLVRVHREIGRPHIDLPLLKRRWLEGLGFSFAGTTEAVNNDLDKIMLSHFGMNRQDGFYTLAYRVLDFATSPISSLNAAVMQRQFGLAKDGIAPMRRLWRKSLLTGAGLGVAIGAFLFVLAPVLPWVAGKDFAQSRTVLQYLSILPLIRSVHQACGTLVTGVGHQNWRTAAQCTVAVLNVALNWIWIPVYGWKGAVWSTLATDGSLAILNGLLSLYVLRITLAAKVELA